MYFLVGLGIFVIMLLAGSDPMAALLVSLVIVGGFSFLVRSHDGRAPYRPGRIPTEANPTAGIGRRLIEQRNREAAEIRRIYGDPWGRKN